MGMLPSHIALLAKEYDEHPIRGTVLTLGQQSVYLTLDEVKDVLESQNITLTPLNNEFDVKSKVNKGSILWDRRTNAQTVLSLMGAKEVFSSDCSQYENPDFVIDLNYPVGNEYYEKFDVILDIGTLEHVFNIPMLLRNLNFMLKKGGEVIIITPSSNSLDHGFYSISPTLFFDFFSINYFNKFSCYLSESDPKMLFLGFPPIKSKIYKYHHVGPQFCLTSPRTIETIFFATKTQYSNSYDIKIPSQSLYSNAPNWSSNENSGDEEIQKVSVSLIKIKLIVKFLYRNFKFLLPSRLLIVIYYLYYFFMNSIKNSTNLTYIGNINCSSNLKTFNCKTTVRLEKKLKI